MYNIYLLVDTCHLQHYKSLRHLIWLANEFIPDTFQRVTHNFFIDYFIMDISDLIIIRVISFSYMMRSWDGKTFHINGLWRGRRRWIPPQKYSKAGLWCFIFCAFDKLLDDTHVMFDAHVALL